MDLLKKGFLTFSELMECWQIDECDIFHLIARKELFPSIFLRANLDAFQFDERREKWRLIADADELERAESDDQYEYIYDETRVSGFYYLIFERESLTELVADEVQLDCPLYQSNTRWQLRNKRVNFEFGFAPFDYNRVLFVEEEIKRYEREKIKKLDEPPKTDLALSEKLKDLEQSLAAANRELDEARIALGEARETIDRYRRAEADKPLTTKERNGLLTVIAALCDYSAIKYDERGTAGQIAKMIEEIGAQMDDDTIRGYLKKIPDALETRKK